MTNPTELEPIEVVDTYWFHTCRAGPGGRAGASWRTWRCSWRPTRAGYCTGAEFVVDGGWTCGDISPSCRVSPTSPTAEVDHTRTRHTGVTPRSRPMDIPLIISVDDHVVEPPDLWTERIPAKYQDRRPACRARLGDLPLRGRGVLLREGRRRRRAVRLVALRRPRVPVPEVVGRGRVLRARRHAHHVRRDPPRLLDQVGTHRRHGRQPHRSVDLLPEHVAPLLRADVPGARRQGARAPLREGLQRLDDRRLVRG